MNPAVLTRLKNSLALLDKSVNAPPGLAKPFRHNRTVSDMKENVFPDARLRDVKCIILAEFICVFNSYFVCVENGFHSHGCPFGVPSHFIYSVILAAVCSEGKTAEALLDRQARSFPYSMPFIGMLRPQSGPGVYVPIRSPLAENYQMARELAELVDSLRRTAELQTSAQGRHCGLQEVCVPIQVLSHLRRVSYSLKSPNVVFFFITNAKQDQQEIQSQGTPKMSVQTTVAIRL
ncbi:hypothetical protein L596_006165 [Steinernema carpocapsae]|uniref:Uncharacterized protein n=1 Tax=Steinernema carpocapsae TaxID=34508 RepID=A0A4U8V2V7_STECR|nr:hypothetical protein L596_006165 [Steinernema carpocapsae]